MYNPSVNSYWYILSPNHRKTPNFDSVAVDAVDGVLVRFDALLRGDGVVAAMAVPALLRVAGISLALALGLFSVTSPPRFFAQIS